MKGIVFSEFLDMVEAEFSADMVDDIIDDSELPSGGAYTAVGTYDHLELAQLVIALSKKTGAGVPALLKAYGRHLFGRFAVGYAHFFEGADDCFEFLASIEDYIHVEVRKLYPDAELPSFETVRIAPDKLSMVYRSPRCLGDFAEGLIEGCSAHYREPLSVARTDEHEGRIVRFELTRAA